MLETIINNKRAVLDRIDRQREIARMVGQVSILSPVRSLKKSLKKGNDISLIAEIKRRSPSKGLLSENLSVAETAHIYESSGARAISVLTEKDNFGGSIDDLRVAHKNASLPVLRKDFIIDPYQIWESRSIGADAILLIAGILRQSELHNMYYLARRIGLEVLVEVHNEDDLEKALLIGPDLIGINNRNLADFSVSNEVTNRLAPMIPDSILKVSESGIHGREDVIKMRDCGINAILVGESIIRSDDRGRKIKELLGLSDDQN